MKRTSILLLTALVAGAQTGCEPITAATSGEARMEVGVQGDGGTRQRSASDSPSADQSGWAMGEASGTVEVRARVFIQGSGGAWVPLTDGAAQQTVEASGSGEVKLLSTARVEAGTYRRVRVEFERVEADLRSGVLIQSGLLTGVVRVDAGGDGEVVVEREVEITARSGTATRVEIDLNASQWLRRADASARTVAEAEFRSAVAITAR